MSSHDDSKEESKKEEKPFVLIDEEAYDIGEKGITLFYI